MNKDVKIAALVPCYNEELTIAQVVADFKRYLPQATVYVYDNNSTDNTIAVAKQAGADVKKVMPKGKGNVIRRMFADIDADVYVIVDGDATYDLSVVNNLVNRLVDDELDMVVGTRSNNKEAYRLGHQWGNRVFNNIISFFFGSKFTDIFSGYRVFSKRFVKSFPAESAGFDTETEITIHALQLSMACAEMRTDYKARPENSHSKLNKFRDGFNILLRIMVLLKETRPLFFFGCIFILLALSSIGIYIPVFITYLKIGLIPRLPTTVLCSAMMLLAFLSLVCGLILDSVSRLKRNIKYYFYLLIDKH